MAESDECADIPPLEDMSDLIRQISTVHQGLHASQQDESASGSSTEARKTNYQENTNTRVEKKSVAEIQKESEGNRTTDDTGCSRQLNQFGGFKRGFLNNKSSKLSDKKKADKTENLVYVKAKQSKEDQLKLPEVQEAMTKSHPMFSTTEWVTDDLLSKIQSNPRLSKQISDPRFANALKKFETDRQGALQEFQDDPELLQFFKEFCQLMGDHFLNFSKSQNNDKITDTSVAKSNPVSADSSMADRKVQEILSDPKIVEILTDARVKGYIDLLKRDPHTAQQYILSASTEFRSKIQKLVEYGVLSRE